MFQPQTSVFLSVPNESHERLLRPGLIVTSNDFGLVVQLDQAFDLHAAGEAQLYFDEQGKFCQIPVKLKAQLLADGSGAHMIAVQVVGTPVSAESRQSFRVSTTSLDLIARVDKERNCAVVDVSYEGMCLLTQSNFRVGTIVQVRFDFEGREISSRARVQTMRLLPGGKYRCGLHVPAAEAETRKNLQLISASAQRSVIRQRTMKLA